MPESMSGTTRGALLLYFLSSTSQLQNTAWNASDSHFFDKNDSVAHQMNCRAS